MNDAIKMQISAFVDGELPQNEAELLLRRLCQDAQLRQQAAEYLAMGRAMRGERAISGIATLRQRIQAELDDVSLERAVIEKAPVPTRFLRPVAGGAIAAAVALAALLGLQQLAEEPEVSAPVGNNAFSGAVGASYSVAEEEDDPLRDYYLRHNVSSSNVGINSINPSVVTWRLRQSVVVEREPAENAADSEPAAGDASETNESTSP